MVAGDFSIPEHYHFRMATKPDRYKKLPPLKGKKTTGTRSTKVPKLTDEEIAEGTAASAKIAKRPTSDFSREELGALMQTAPGGAEPHQIKTQSRQFNRVAGDMPEAIVADKRVSPGEDLRHKKPMSAKTPKIDLND
jgi:hypothetical protein